MMRIMFFIMGIPMMILSFFDVVDVLPFVSQTALIVDGNEIELTEQQQQSVENELASMLNSSHTLPAFGVISAEEFANHISQGKFLNLKFDTPLEINGLPFDELVFEVLPELQAFNIFRGNNGVFQGRCIYVDLNENSMQKLSNLINQFELTEEEKGQNIVQPSEEGGSYGQNENSQIEDVVDDKSNLDIIVEEELQIKEI